MKDVPGKTVWRVSDFRKWHAGETQNVFELTYWWRETHVPSTLVPQQKGNINMRWKLKYILYCGPPLSHLHAPRGRFGLSSGVRCEKKVNNSRLTATCPWARETKTTLLSTINISPLPRLDRDHLNFCYIPNSVVISHNFWQQQKRFAKTLTNFFKKVNVS